MKTKLNPRRYRILFHLYCCRQNGIGGRTSPQVAAHCKILDRTTDWALAFLDQHGLVAQDERGQYSITDFGVECLLSADDEGEE